MGSRKVIYVIVIFLLVISIVHFPGVVGEEDKHRVITEEEFQDKLKNKDYDFSWCVFPFEVNLSGLTLTNADFSNAIFEVSEDYTRFIGTTFKGDVHFEDVIFKGKVAFNGAIFEQSVSFKCTTDEKTFQGGVSFSRTTFGDEEKEEEYTTDFTNVIFSDYANFEYAIFNGKTIFEKAKFLNSAIRFVHAEFYDEVYFDKAEFNEKGGYTTFDDVKFGESVNFISAEFKGKDTSFRDAVFEQMANFTDVTFEDETDFRGVTFESKAIFEEAIFKGRVKFQEFNKKTTFNDVSFDGANFKKSVYFNGINFGGYASFKEGTVFYNSVDFTNVDFNANVIFYKTVFEGRVIFRDTEFKKETKFDRATFKKEADFTCAKFGKKNRESAEFTNVTFEGITLFEQTNFFGKAKFDGTTFEKNVYFDDGTTFEKNVDFTGVTFRGNTEFEGTIFKGNHIIFEKASFERKCVFKPCPNSSYELINLKGTDFFQYARIYDLDLTKTIILFKDAYLVNVNFIKCEWPEDFKLYEEREEKLNYEDLETVYRNLKNSFTKYGQSDLAGKAFYREMEMKKLRAKEEGKCLLKCWYWFLKWSCGYGEKTLRIIGWDIGIMGFFAFLFWILGISINTLPRHNIEGFEIDYFRRHVRDVDNRYKIHGSHEHRNLDKIWSFFSWIGVTDFAYCLLFSIASFSTLGAKYIKPKGNASRWLSALESLIGAFFIALFIYVFVRKMLR